MDPFRRFLVVVLVALAASPLTVPFATCDLLDLLGDGDDVSSTALKPPKTHEATASLTAPVHLRHDPPPDASADLRAAALDNSPRRVFLPLRL